MNSALKSSSRISDLPVDERPRERLARLGPQALSIPELLVTLLWVGVPGESAVQVGQRLLTKYKNLAGLHRAPFEDLCSQRGIGEAKAAQIKAAIELGRLMARQPADHRTTVNSPSDAAALVAYDMSAQEQGIFSVILLDTRNQLIDIVDVYLG